MSQDKASTPPLTGLTTPTTEPLTFGIEIEFALAGLFDGQPDPHPERKLEFPSQQVEGIFNGPYFTISHGH